MKPFHPFPRFLPLALMLFVWQLPRERVQGQNPKEEAAKKPAAFPGHWAFRPPINPPLPKTRNPAAKDLDRFILAALEAKGQTLGLEADRATLLRRVSFGLTGLPPTPAEMDAYHADQKPGAYERMVERFLASPRYGERWGKYWLDAAGYADSNGYFNADSDRPLAWRYRDYVIRAFNADKPYDRFVLEQLAGDELAGYDPQGDIDPQTAELLTATHFLRNAPDGTGESDGNPDEVRIDRYTVMEGNLQIAMNCLLGITIQCARCHKHKFEPITQTEYYRLQAILIPVYNPERWIKPNDRVVAVGSRVERAEWQRRTDLVDRQIKALQDGLKWFAQPLREQLLGERLPKLTPTELAHVIQALNTPQEKRTPAQQVLMKTHAREVAISEEDLAKRFPEYQSMREQTRKTQAERAKDRPPPLDQLAVTIETDPKPPVHHLLRRGQHHLPGEEVEPGAPAAISPKAYRIEPRPTGQRGTGRRTAFARWVTSVDNPLFARVMVNRLWHHHFGVGLSPTIDNLGQSGARPTHPELLDYLACEFVRGGWSIKAMHRLILHSATYRQSSASRPHLLKLDPDNHLLGRFPLRRLDAEALRDAWLSIAGDLETKLGGPYVPTRRTAEGLVEVAEKQEGAKRRSIYLQQRRTQVDTLLHLFDAPALVSTCSVRTTSTVPLQALALLNSDFVRARARGFAQRCAREAEPNDQARLLLAYRLAYGRPPSGEELAASLRFLTKQRQAYATHPDPDFRVWIDLCQTILASNAFLYVE